MTAAVIANTTIASTSSTSVWGGHEGPATVHNAVLTNNTANRIDIDLYWADDGGSYQLVSVTIPPGIGKAIIVPELMQSFDQGNTITATPGSADSFNVLLTGELFGAV
jgi:hypothetical protein